MRFGRWTIAVLIAAGLLIFQVTTGRSQPAPAAPPSPAPAPSSDPLGTAWTRPMADVIGLSVSPNGSRVIAVDERGTLRCFDSRGRNAWEQRLEGVDSVAQSSGGEVTVAYARRQPLSRHVYLIDADGTVFHVFEAEAPVTAVAVAADGRLAAVGSGNSIRLCLRSGRRVETRLFRLSGQVEQVDFAPAGNLYVGMRDPDAVELIKPNGKTAWRRAGEGPPSISASADGRWLAVGSRVDEENCRLRLLDHRNREVWSITRPGRSPRVRLTASGSAVLMTYEHRVEHGDQSRYERRLAYFTDKGEGAWTKGGAFTAPLYVGAAPGGDWIVALEPEERLARGVGPPRFRLFKSTGSRLWIYSCPTHVLIVTASRDGRRIAAYRTDGVVEALQVRL